ncbi:uncharacterized protein FOMMEDRAFT_162048 [Fomitiporia mediterranea MF3/22]|uniref:uncharacterized protein n=1 Tax=Fomitiporia mediterranea (strain MF3/22) TaxID=694068 RepID=UPI000440731A|nr:uncharacterized protein FOMMEDRAFT_162048 [Fomitiporia mediterranea MF3/22]EJC98282.1 hypothetical protein FOMMEDRAFT_162048 [Fomitiporia mediterranea MF3/22]
MPFIPNPWSEVPSAPVVLDYYANKASHTRSRGPMQDPASSLLPMINGLAPKQTAQGAPQPYPEWGLLSGNPSAQPTFIFKSSLSNLQKLILDAVIVCLSNIAFPKHTIDRSYVCTCRFIALTSSGIVTMLLFCIPIWGWFALLTSCIVTIVALASAARHAYNTMFAVRTTRWITAIYPTTLATNLSSSSRLAYRIWRVNCDVAKYRAIGSSRQFSAPSLNDLNQVQYTPYLCVVGHGLPNNFHRFNLLTLRVVFATNRRLLVLGRTLQQTTTLTTSRFRPNIRRDMKTLTVETTQFFESDAELPLSLVTTEMLPTRPKGGKKMQERIDVSTVLALPLSSY